MDNLDLPKSIDDMPGLIPWQLMPENLESPVNNVLSWLTPNEMYYIRNHLPYPTISMESWALGLAGEVENPLNISFEEVQPKAAPWNAKGYGNNSIHEIKVMVPQIIH